MGTNRNMEFYVIQAMRKGGGGFRGMPCSVCGLTHRFMLAFKVFPALTGALEVIVCKGCMDAGTQMINKCYLEERLDMRSLEEG